MVLKVISTGSIGNAYILENTNEALLIECGVNIKKIKQAMNYDFSKLAGAIVTHSHLDHSCAINEVMRMGVDVYALKETFRATGFSVKSNRQKEIEPLQRLKVGGFRILPFEVNHDVPCVGFLIEHQDCGRTLFLTDTYFTEYTFPGLNNIIVEANFSQEIIDRKMREGASPEFLRNRILRSHLSLENCKELLQANDLSKVNNIVLIHLSDSNSNEEQFQSEIQELTGKNVSVASAGMEIPFTKTPF